MGASASVAMQEQEARRRSRSIDDSIAADKEKQARTVKILMLGKLFFYSGVIFFKHKWQGMKNDDKDWTIKESALLNKNGHFKFPPFSSYISHFQTKKDYTFTFHFSQFHILLYSIFNTSLVRKTANKIYRLTG